MYAQRLLVEVIVGGQRRPCPLDWLDAFACAILPVPRNSTTPFRSAMVCSKPVFAWLPPDSHTALAEWLTKRGKGGGKGGGQRG